MECASIFGLLSLSKVSYVFGAWKKNGEKKRFNIFAHRLEDFLKNLNAVFHSTIIVTTITKKVTFTIFSYILVQVIW